jgi:hypothetical protein
MTYSQGSPGYPPAQPPGSYGASTPSFAKAEAGPSKLPLYLTAAVVVLGLAAYLASFGPMFTLSADIGPFGAELSGGGGDTILAALVAALLAAVSLLPKAKNFTAVVAVIAVLGALLVVGQLVSKPNGFSIGWALWLVLGLTILQAIAAVGALLLDAGVISAPAPRPTYEPYGQYGPPPGGYYGQPGGPQHVPQGPPPQSGPGQRSGYPSQYGGYSSGSSTGGFSSMGPQSGPPTPPTGFPSFSPPPAVGSGQQTSGSGQQQPQTPSSAPSGPAPS